MTTDLFYRRLTILAGTARDDDRSIEALLATSHRSRAVHPQRQELIDEALRIDGGELPDELPLLDGTLQANVKNVLGSVREIRRDGERIFGRLHFAEDLISNHAWLLVRAGILSDAALAVEPLESEASGFMLRRGVQLRTRWAARAACLTIIGVGDGRDDEPLARLFADSLGDFVMRRLLDVHRGAGPMLKVLDAIAYRAGCTDQHLQSVLDGKARPDERLVRLLANEFEADELELHELARAAPRYNPAEHYGRHGSFDEHDDDEDDEPLHSEADEDDDDEPIGEDAVYRSMQNRDGLGVSLD